MKYSSAALMAALALGITVPSFAANSTQNQGINQNEFYNVNYDFDSPSVTLGKQSSPYIIFKLPTKDGEIIRYLRLNQGGYLIDIPEISLNSVEINGTEASNYNYDKTVIDTSKKYTPGETVVGNVIVTIPSDGSVGSGGTYDLESMVITGSVDGPDMPETPWHPTVDTTPIKVTNVAAGTVSATSTDAINGSQLFTAMQNAGKTYTAGTNITISDSNVISASGTGTSAAGNTGLITGDTLYQTVNNINTATNTALANKADKNAGNLTADDVVSWQGKLGNGQNKAGDTGLITGDTLHTAINNVSGDITNINNALTNKADTNLSNITNEGKTIIRDLAKGAVKVINGTNTTVTPGTDGESITYAVNVSTEAIKGAVKSDLDKKANVDASNLSNNDVSKWQEKLGTGQISEGNTGLVTGGTVYEVVKNVSGESLVKTDGKTITIDKTGTATTIDLSHTTKDGKSKGRVLTGVLTDVSDDTSVVNVGTLTGALDTYGQNVSQQIGSLDRKLTKDIGKAGATAAALAALHPLSYDPSNKLNFAVGQGHYKGQNSTALGVFYTPNEDIQLNLGGTVTGSDKAINGGISFRIGSGNSEKKIVKTSEFNALKEQNKAMAEQLNALAQQVKQLSGQGLALNLTNDKAEFPDVPSDHWAKEAVDTLHGNEVLEGYPDGEFKGDQKMSRYEYAQMLYKAARK